MGETPSRRTFLGVGLGCAAPVLLGTSLAEAASRVLPALTARPPADPVLEHLRQQALGQYRHAHDAVEATGRVPGEQLRATAANIGLLRAYAHAHRHDVAADAMLRERRRRDGREATTAAVLERYAIIRRDMEEREGILLPEEPDTARAGLALDALAGAGCARVAGLAGRWAAWQARRADAAGLAFARPAALGQKAGEDFYGWPMDETAPDLGCGDLQILLDEVLLAGVIMAFIDPPLALAIEAIGAVLMLIKDIACRRAT